MSEGSQGSLFAALSLAQAKIEGAKKRNLNPHFKSRYADLASVWDACREELTEQGLSVLQFPVTPVAGYNIALETVVAHKSGQSISSRFDLTIKDPSNPQAVGSALTYMRRYALMAAVGIAPEDDDANASTAKGSAPTAKPAAPVNVDWDKEAKDALVKFDSMKTDTDKRILYGQVRASSMTEPQKTATLTEMANRINATK